MEEWLAQNCENCMLKMHNNWNTANIQQISNCQA